MKQIKVFYLLLLVLLIPFCTAARSEDGGGQSSVKKIIGLKKFNNITLKRGVTQDGSLWNWEQGVKGADGGGQSSVGKTTGGGQGSVKKIIGLKKFNNITLKRGVTQDESLWNWEQGVKGGDGGGQSSAGKTIGGDRKFRRK